MLEYHISFLKDELESLKRMEYIICVMKTVDRKVADAEGNVSTLVDGLRRVSYER